MPEITSSAVELREAARLMRERAEAATQGPWHHMCLGSEGCQILRDGTVRERGRSRVARFGMKDWMADHADAEFVTSMHPGVALALAEWLETEAHMADWRGNSVEGQTFGALKVARAYLSTKEGGGNV